MPQTGSKDPVELERILRQNLESSCIDDATDFGAEKVRKIIDAVLAQWKRENEGEEISSRHQ